MTVAPTVLFHARNRRGLGHLVRTHNIATALHEHAPDLAVHVHATRRPPAALWDGGIELTTDDEQPWDVTVRRHQPHVIVHDTTLRPPFDTGRHVLVMRRRTVAEHATLLADPALARVQRVIVPHRREEFGHALPSWIAERTEFVGPIVRPVRESAGAVRRRWGIAADSFLTTITVGGGGFAAQADRFFEFAAAIAPAIACQRPDAQCVVVLGPNYDNPRRARDLASLPGCTVVDHVPYLVDLIAASDLVVAEGGYNTATEVSHAGVPAVFIPSERGLDDQRERVDRIAARGEAIVVRPDTTPSQAAERVAALVADRGRLAAMGARARAHPPCLGNGRAAEIIAGEAA